MDVQPPRDDSLRNIIDKLAEFVARNGPEFEAITKQKQQNNPKFEFLYGGEFASYYQFRVAAEQALLNKQSQAGHFLQHPPPMQSLQPMQPNPPPALYPQQAQQPPPQQLPPESGAHADSLPTQPHMWPPNPGQGPPPNSQQANGSSALALGLSSQLEAIQMQQKTLREQIKQSDANLSAQHTALMKQKTQQIEEAIAAAQTTQLDQISQEQGIVLRDFDAVLQPIIESCTKDSISAGKNWILQHSTDSAKINVVLQYLLKKALVNGSTFQQKLHLIYLVNDILHHCMRKNLNDLKNNLENVVIPMFCSADLIASADQRQKLAKLLSLWESKGKFFDACVISKLQSPDSSMQEYKTNLQNTHHEITAKFTQNTKATLDNYQKQHQIFMQHASQQIAQFEQQKLQLEQQLMVAQKAQPPHMHPGGPPPKNIPSLMAQRIAMPGVNHEQMGQPPATHDPQGNNLYPGGNYHQQPHPAQQPSNPFADPRGPNFFIPDMSKPPPGFAGPMHPHNPMPLQQQPQPQQQQLNQQNPSPFPPMQQGQGGGGGGGSEPPVDLGVLNAAIQAVMQMQRHPDDPQSQQMQQQPPHPQQQQQQLAGYPPNIRPGPSPGQAQQPPHQMEDGQQPGEGEETADGEPVAIGEPQIPTAPYYDLPAGLMVPLIRLEDYNYKALDPADIRLPAPAPQSERLTNALNAFYAAPSHDHPRDNEGWEKLGLYEYYKVKNAARKQKEEEISNGTREKSRSPSPILLEKPEPKKPKKRSYRSKSRSRSRSKTPPHRDRSRSHSRSRSRSPERSSTPPPLPRNRMGGGGNNRKGNNRSPRHERDTNSSNNNQENRSERTNSSNNGNNASRRVERDRSPTPPSFMGAGGPKPAEYLDESNKGHQMLKKMGWAGTGTGLGSKNQGIDKPISGGEVRDRRDMYRGVGINMNDPFESFRKNKGAAFAHRMRTRDDKS